MLHLVAGGCGFLGRHVARLLKERGDEVVIADSVEFPDASFEVRSKILDLSQAGTREFDHLIANVDVVHHYAWTTLPSTANVDPLADLRDNLAITIGFLDALKRRGAGRIVFSSSGGTVYGRLRKIPVRECHPLEPIAAYGVSKVAAEHYLGLYRHLFNVDTRIARLSNPYGAGQNPFGGQGVATVFAHRALAGEPIELWGSGDVIRDFIYIEDAAAGLVAVADAPSMPETISPIFNIGSGTGTKIAEIIPFIEREIGEPVCIENKPSRLFDVPASVLDISKAQSILSWSPVVSLQDGIAKMIADLKVDRKRRFASHL